MSCTLVSTRRPPFFDELLVDSDERSRRTEALVLYSKKTLKLTAALCLRPPCTGHLDACLR